MNIDRVRILLVSNTEVLQLQKIGIATFVETFVDDCTPSDMEKYLEEKHNLDLLKLEFYNPESQFFFAELDGVIVAYLKINTGKAQSESKLENALEIERLYVLSTYQGLGLGQLLMDKALSIAKAKQYQNVWLGVWEHNHKAIRFYEKNGFIIFDGPNPLNKNPDRPKRVHPFKWIGYTRAPGVWIADGLGPLLAGQQRLYDALYNMSFDLLKFSAGPMFLLAP
jgi:ribosomal protein S18 acetylase RimI-like enzyme